MNLIPYDVDNIGGYYKQTKIMAILEEFEKSGLTCAKVEDHHYKNAKACYGAFHNAIIRFHMNGIRVFTRNENVFLIRENA